MTLDEALKQHLDLGPDSRGRELVDAILDVAGCLVVILDREGRIVLFNRACEAATGYRAEEVLRTPIWDRLLVPEQRDAVRTVFAELRNGILRNQFENDWLTKDGRRRQIRWSNASVAGGDGRVAYIIGTGLDVTDYQRTDEALADREARLQAILRTAVEGIVTIDEQGVIDSINPAAERIFGYERDELVGCNVSMLMPSPHRENHDHYIARYLAGGRAHIIGIGREVEGQRKDGSLFPLELAVSELSTGGRRLFTGMVRDISDRRKAEEKARLRLHDAAHTARLLELGEMTSGIAHEVNQPLAAIVSFAGACLRMLESGGDNAEVLRDALEQIAAQGERAGQIIQRLRQFARKGALERRPFDINKAIEEVLALIRHDLHRHGVSVKLELDEALPKVRADEVQIEQVLLNLARNAVEAMEDLSVEERRLTFCTRPGARGELEIQVQVSDTGIGLPADALERVFETFYTTKSGGVGVGLAISRSIIDAHGGRLMAGSNPGGGAVFTFTLPYGNETAHGD